MNANERSEHEPGKTPNWVERGAQLADEIEAEMRLARVLSERLEGWSQADTADASGAPLRDRDYDHERIARSQAWQRIRAATTPEEIHDALRRVPLSVLRGLRRHADAGTVPEFAAHDTEGT